MPHVVFILGGQVTVMPEGESTSIAGGKLKTVIPTVPDVPIGHFRLTLFGGKQGYLENTQSLCGIADRLDGPAERPERQDPDPAGQGEDRLQGDEEVKAPQTTRAQLSARLQGARL